MFKPFPVHVERFQYIYTHSYSQTLTACQWYLYYTCLKQTVGINCSQGCNDLDQLVFTNLHCMYLFNRTTAGRYAYICRSVIYAVEFLSEGSELKFQTAGVNW